MTEQLTVALRTDQFISRAIWIIASAYSAYVCVFDRHSMCRPVIGLARAVDLSTVSLSIAMRSKCEDTSDFYA